MKMSSAKMAAILSREDKFTLAMTKNTVFPGDALFIKTSVCLFETPLVIDGSCSIQLLALADGP